MTTKLRKFVYCTLGLCLFFLPSSVHGGQVDIENFVTRFYEECLNRSPDIEGLDGWVNALQSGNLTAEDLAEGFIFSKEFTSLNTSHEEFITILYRVFMDREPDLSGFNGWVNALYLGMSRSTVFNQFVSSTEFEKICTKYEIFSSVTTGSIVEQFVTRFYEKCLNRSPDTEGLEGWVNALQNGNLTAEDLAERFIFSQEFTSLNTTNEEFVKILYQVFMDREPDASGFNGWTNALYSYMNRLEVFHAFVVSPEFSMLCDEYGINASDKGTTTNSAESFFPYSSDSTDTITWRYRINNGQPIRPYLQGSYLTMQLSDLQLSINNKDLIRRGVFSGTIYGDASGTVSAESLEHLAPSNESALITEQTFNLEMTLSAYGETAKVDLHAVTKFHEPFEWFLDRTDLDTLPLYTPYNIQGEIYGSLNGYMQVSGDINFYESFSDTVTSADSWELRDKLDSYTVMGVTYHNVVVVDLHTKVPSFTYPYYPEDVDMTYWVAKGIGLIKGVGQYRLLNEPLEIELVETNLHQ